MTVDPEMYADDVGAYETPPGLVIVGYWCHRGCGFMDPGAYDASCWGTHRAHPVYSYADLPDEWITSMREQIAKLEYVPGNDDLPTLRRKHLDWLNDLYKDVKP